MKMFIIIMMMIGLNIETSYSDVRLDWESTDTTGKSMWAVFNKDFSNFDDYLKAFDKFKIVKISFYNLNLDSVPKRILDFSLVELIEVKNCKNIDNLFFNQLRNFPNLQYLKIIETNYVKLRSDLFYSNKLKNIRIAYVDTLEFDNLNISNKDLSIELSTINNLMFSDINNIYLIKHFNIEKSKSSRNMTNMLNSIRLGIVNINCIHLDSVPNNFRYLNGFSIRNCNVRMIPDFFDHSNFRTFGVENNKIETIPTSLFTKIGIEFLGLSNNKLKEFRFDLIKDSTFSFINLSGIREENWRNYYNGIDISCNFIDSIPNFTDTLENKYYSIDISYNNRKPIDSEADESEFNKYNPKDFFYTPPKGLLNLQFRGIIILKGYNLSDEEKDKIKKHFKYAVVEF